MAGFALFYLIFVSAWAWSIREYWPFLAFGWLLVGKLAVVFERRGDVEREHVARSAWAVSGIAYLPGAFVSVLIPLPRFGLDATVVAKVDLAGAGLWIDEPHRVMAFGFLYFGVLALTKWRGTLLPVSVLPTMSRRIAGNPPTGTR